MYYNKRFSDKPQGIEIGNVQKNLQQTEIAIKDLAQGLSNGATFKPALLNGTKSTDFINQQLFALDFDDGLKIDEALNKCIELNLHPVFGYTTFSHSPEHHKFRLVFCATKIINDVQERDKIQLILMGLFKEVDPKCKDISRLFFGGKKLIIEDYDRRIDTDALIKDNESILTSNNSTNKTNTPKKTTISNKSNSLKTTTNKSITYNDNDIDYDIINQKVSAIRALNVEILRGLVGGNKSPELYKLSYYLRRKTPCYEGIEIPTFVGSRPELFELLNDINLNYMLSIPENAMVKCILPSHEDNDASAHIFTMDSGSQIYKCFGCNTVRTPIGLVEHLAGCTRQRAVKFLQDVYNVELLESDWIKEQRQIMIDSANYISTKEFELQFPVLNNLIKTRKGDLKLMLYDFSQKINDDMFVSNGDAPIFFGSYKTLADICNIDLMNKKSNTKKVAQDLTLFSLLNILTKVEKEQIPKKELNRAISIATKYDHDKLTTFLKFNQLGVETLTDSESKAIILKKNNITFEGLTREYILRTFGEEEANKCYPQYKHYNASGTTKKSDIATLRIVKRISKYIDKKGYILENDIFKNSITEAQWRKSITEILNSYGWKRQRLNKDLKKEYNITCKGYPYIITLDKELLDNFKSEQVPNQEQNSDNEDTEYWGEKMWDNKTEDSSDMNSDSSFFL